MQGSTSTKSRPRRRRANLVPARGNPLLFSLIACLALAAAVAPSSAAGLERVIVAPDGKSFTLAESGAAFRVWGVNYDHDSEGENGRLLEDYWETEWENVQRDFREMKALGANVVRVHLQFAKFMRDRATPDEASLATLHRLLELAEQTGLYLDLTGLGCYRKTDTPAWYDAMDEESRWSSQARFWSAIAETSRHSPAVFCYDLMNEPIIGGNPDDGWLAGELGGKWYVQRITRTPGDRPSTEIARAWIEKLTTAIRAQDRSHLITVGAIPWALTWPGAKPVFYAPGVGDSLDFVSIHLYPKKTEVDQALTALGVYELGKPLLIEETFPLSCSIEEMGAFLQRSRDLTAGYVSFYWGKTIAEYTSDPPAKTSSSLMRKWLTYFREHAAGMK